MADPTDTAREARRKLLWDLSVERRVHARHSETLRATATGYALAGASALIAVITLDKEINYDDLPLAFLLLVIGIVGALFSTAYTERSHQHRNRANSLLKELDSEISLGFPISVEEIEDASDNDHRHAARSAWMRKLDSSRSLWVALPLFIALLGIILICISLAHPGALSCASNKTQVRDQ
jgi:hypothetical protein